jgi:aspartyl-tRNA(Asn)/glutamyl-tRNA(Gln) amidotransferase subunit A
VVGVKPTYGLVSRYGLVAFASSLDQIGPLATTVADAALALEVLAGHDRADSTSIPQPAPTLATALVEGVDGLRIGVVRELVEGVDPDVGTRVSQAAAGLEAAGAKVDEASLPSAALALSAYYLIATAEASSNLARFDGVRYGLRVEGDDVTAMYGRTRAAGFGAEVKRRIMLGDHAGDLRPVRRLLRRLLRPGPADPDAPDP